MGSSSVRTEIYGVLHYAALHMAILSHIGLDGYAFTCPREFIYGAAEAQTQLAPTTVAHPSPPTPGPGLGKVNTKISTPLLDVAASKEVLYIS